MKKIGTKENEYNNWPKFVSLIIIIKSITWAKHVEIVIILIILIIMTTEFERPVYRACLKLDVLGWSSVSVFIWPWGELGKDDCGAATGAGGGGGGASAFLQW